MALEAVRKPTKDGGGRKTVQYRDAAGRTFSVIVEGEGTNKVRPLSIGTTNASAAITSSSGFSSQDVGAAITGTGIPASTTITTVTDSSNATLSANATATGSPTATITRTDKLGGVDIWFEHPFTGRSLTDVPLTDDVKGTGVYLNRLV